MRVGLLGPLVLDDVRAATLNPRDRVVLAALAVRPGACLTLEQLADALWGDRPPASWSKNLQGCVVRIRRALGPDAVETVPHGYRLALGPTDVDVRDFEQRVARGRELLRSGEPERAAYQLEEAIGLWRGRPLEELAAWEPGAWEAMRLEELREDARDWWLEARLQSGGHRDVLAAAVAMVRDAPCRERRWHMLATAQYRSGRQADALETLRRARLMLADDLGLDPGPDLTALELAVLRHAPELDRVEARLRRDPGPVLEIDGVLVVVDPPGRGTTPFVRAGVAAALVIDQAEEAVQLCHDLRERAAFWDAVGRYADSASLLVAVQADRTGSVASQPAVARRSERRLVATAAVRRAAPPDRSTRPS